MLVSQTQDRSSYPARGSAGLTNLKQEINIIESNEVIVVFLFVISPAIESMWIATRFSTYCLVLHWENLSTTFWHPLLKSSKPSQNTERLLSVSKLICNKAACFWSIQSLNSTLAILVSLSLHWPFIAMMAVTKNVNIVFGTILITMIVLATLVHYWQCLFLFITCDHIEGWTHTNLGSLHRPAPPGQRSPCRHCSCRPTPAGMQPRRYIYIHVLNLWSL